MNHALYIAATGMQAQQLSIETTASNVSNVNTSGYKAAQVAFEDLMVRGAAPVQAAAALGAGVHGSVAVRDFTPGELKPSEAPEDVAIRGHGFFELMLADGTRAYSRGGRLSVSAAGMLALANGLELASGVQVSGAIADLSIAADGRVFAQDGGARPQEIGQLELATFANPGALRPLGNGVYAATEASGEALRRRPGEDGNGTVAHQFVEASNVKMADEMMNMMQAQRAYQLNAKLIEAADEMTALTNNLRRG